MSRRARRALALTVVTTLLVGACGRGSGDDERRASITVFAAASLTDAMTDLAGEFERDTADVVVEFSFGPSSGLREQVLAGAPVDVFASADAENMEVLVSSGEVEDPAVFATNRLQIAVPPGNPAAVTGLADFADPDLFIGLCAPEVPCGALARGLLDAAGVEPEPDTAATDVRALLTQVASGELDAGLVYETDVLAAGDDVEGIDTPRSAEVRAEYFIGTVDRSGDRGHAGQFVSFVTSDEGRAILEGHGFRSP